MILRIQALLAGMALVACTASVESAESEPEKSEPPTQRESIAPTETQGEVQRFVGGILSNMHYLKPELDDELSGRILDRYLETLDPNRSYFLASDIESFETYRTELDDAISKGRLEPAYWIYGIYLERVRSRMEYALSLLEEKPDFTTEESYRFDRSDADWPADREEAREIWRKRVKNDAIGMMLTDHDWDETVDVLEGRYENFLRRRVTQVTSEDVFETFMNAFTRSLDPHSAYFSPHNKEEFEIRMSLSLEGIGASLQLIDEYVTVMRIVPGGPADKAGTLEPEDRITGVAQGEEGEMIDVVGWRLDEVVEKIRGPKGSVVRLRVLPGESKPGDPQETFQFVRNKIKLEEQAAQKTVVPIERDGKTRKVGVINIPTFYMDFEARRRGEEDYRSTTRDVRALLKELRGEDVDAVVVDLRNNGGGSLIEATELTGLFIDEGPVVQLRDQSGDVDVARDDKAGVAWDGPLGVLVNRFSASASEIFAGAIQDYNRGVIIGNRTYGKGTIQNLIDLSRYFRDDEVGQIKYTVGKYYRVSGSSTQSRGVKPDIELPSLVDPEDYGESSKPTALLWGRMDPAEHERYRFTDELIPSLRDAHARRLDEHPELSALMEDIEDIRSRPERDTVSLVLEERRGKVEERKDERLKRENARRIARGLEPVDSLDETETDDDILRTESARIMIDFLEADPAYVGEGPKLAGDLAS